MLQSCPHRRHVHRQSILLVLACAIYETLPDGADLPHIVPQFSVKLLKGRMSLLQGALWSIFVTCRSPLLVLGSHFMRRVSSVASQRKEGHTLLHQSGPGAVRCSLACRSIYWL